MPLLDHFHRQVKLRYPWESFHSSWATRIADALNERWLPADFIAAENTHLASLEIDVATFEQKLEPMQGSANGLTVSTAAQTWTPTTVPRTMPATFPDTFEVRVYAQEGGLTLVAAIELISPSNKDRDEQRRAFATKCAGYLAQGISLIMLDVVTSRHANLHNELMQVMEKGEEWHIPSEGKLYAVAYRPVVRQERSEIDFWPETCAVGSPLPTMPLRLTGDLFVPVDFEAAYMETCRRRRLA
jgi:hypothetical protein